MTQNPIADQENSLIENEPGEKNEPLDFSDVFRRACNEFDRNSPPVEDLYDEYMEAIYRSAIAKCLDFNIVANQKQKVDEISFFLVSNIRVICEDLLYCAYFKKIDDFQAREIALAMQEFSLRRSILAQTRFFSKNNSVQPTLGGLQDSKDQSSQILKKKNYLKSLWQKQNLGRVESPNLRALSSKVGLKSTYYYVYHMSSNFVHFNPSHLLRLGWGPNEGPFSFSINHFSGYYSNVSRFLGAILFLGFCCLFSDKFNNSFSEFFDRFITEKLESGIRWPEIITYEEMNIELPNVIMQAANSMIRREDPEAFPRIIPELRSLKYLSK